MADTYSCHPSIYWVTYNHDTGEYEDNYMWSTCEVPYCVSNPLEPGCSGYEETPTMPGEPGSPCDPYLDPYCNPGSGGGDGGTGGEGGGGGTPPPPPAPPPSDIAFCHADKPGCLLKLTASDKSKMAALMNHVKQTQQCQDIRNTFTSMLNSDRVFRGDENVQYKKAEEDTNHVAQYDPNANTIHIDDRFWQHYVNGGKTTLTYNDAMAKVVASALLHEAGHKFGLTAHNSTTDMDAGKKNFLPHSPFHVFNYNPPDPATSCINW